MSTVLNTINFSTPFLVGVPTSQVSPAWIRLLGSLITTIQQQDVTTTEELQAFTFTERQAPNQSQRIADLELMLQAQSRRPLPALLSAPDDLVGMILSKTASAANSVAIMDEVAKNATVYPLWADGTAGARRVQSSSSKWTFNPSTGLMTANQLVATTGFGCNGASAQTAYPSGGDAPAGGVGTAAGGWDTAAHRDAAITLLNNIRAALVANGIMS